MLNKIAEAWKSDREHIVTSSDKILSQLRSVIEVAGGSGKINETVRRKAYEQFAAAFDDKLGGFGGAPKFPRPVTLNFLFDFYGADPVSKEGKHALEMSILPNVNALDSATVLEALRAVEEPFRAPLTLFYLEQFSYQEIADMLEVPIGTVMSRLSRGKALLRQRLLAKEDAVGNKVVAFQSDRREGSHG